MANRIPRSRFPRSVKRATTWVQAAVMAETSIGAASTKVLLQRLTAASIAIIGAPTTVVRTRGLVSVRTDQISAVEDQIGALGICVVSDQAAAAGIASIPGPMSNPEWDGWFTYAMFANSFEVGSGVGFDPKFANVLRIDSRAMRKVSTNESIVGVYEAGANSLGSEVLVNQRLLLKLH